MSNIETINKYKMLLNEIKIDNPNLEKEIKDYKNKIKKIKYVDIAIVAFSFCINIIATGFQNTFVSLFSTLLLSFVMPTLPVLNSLDSKKEILENKLKSNKIKEEIYQKEIDNYLLNEQINLNKERDKYFKLVKVLPTYINKKNIIINKKLKN